MPSPERVLNQESPDLAHGELVCYFLGHCQWMFGSNPLQCLGAYRLRSMVQFPVRVHLASY